MRQKGFAPIIVIVLVIGLIAALYFYIAKPFNTTNKSVSQPQTSEGNAAFLDNKKTFTFQYPQGSKQIRSADPTPIGGTSFQADYYNRQTDGTWSLQVVTSPIDTDLNAHLIQTKEELKKTYKRVEDTTVAGEPGVIYYFEDNPGKTIEFGHKGFWYSISEANVYGSQEGDNAQMDKAFNLVVSTFKLLK